jgi:hypothetical protein
MNVATDRASSTIGEHNGLVAKLSEWDWLTLLVGICCTSQRLNLTVHSYMKGVKYPDEVHLYVGNNVIVLQKISKEKEAKYVRGPKM